MCFVNIPKTSRVRVRVRVPRVRVPSPRAKWALKINNLNVFNLVNNHMLTKLKSYNV